MKPIKKRFPGLILPFQIIWFNFPEIFLFKIYPEMEKINMQKKTLIFNVLHFLGHEIGASDLTEEKKESIEVAIQCLETAYEITSEDRQNLHKVDLLNQIRVLAQVRGV